MDFGTDSVRAILVDSADGSELANSVCNYKRWKAGLYSDAAVSQFRQHPLDYLEAMTEVVKTVVAECGDPSLIKAISIDSTGSTPCLVDENLEPLSLQEGFEDDPDAMFILWKDHTSEEEAAEITEHCSAHMPDYACHMGNNYSPECFWAKILHVLRKSERIRDKVYSAMELCDWIPAVLTGCRKIEDIKASHCAAGAKQMWAKEWGGFPPESFFSGIDPMLVPILEHLPDNNFSCSVSAGTLTGRWAEIFGLSEKTEIGVGNIDSHSGAVGGGVSYKNMVMNFGTSACYMAVVPNDVMRGRIVDGVFGQAEGSILEGMDGFEVGLSAFGDLFAWMKRLLCWPLENILSSVLDGEIIRNAEDRILEELTEKAALLPLRYDAPVATDYFNGRRVPHPDGSLTGSLAFLNISSTAPEIFRALVESTAFATKTILDYMSLNGVAIDRLIAIGGVSIKSPFTMQMMSDVLERRLEVSSSRHAGALGAAIHASVIAGIYDNVTQAQANMCQPVMRIYEPDLSGKDILNFRYRKYTDMVHFTETERTVRNQSNILRH